MARIAIVFCLLLTVVAAAPKKKRPSGPSGKIVGGNEIDISEVSYLVSLQLKGKPYCGASIIGQKFLLTAAHCVERRTASEFSIRAGSNTHAKGGETKKVKKIIMHPEYSHLTAQNDIAVLELNEPITNPNIKPIELAEKEPKEGEQILVSGWGGTKEGESSTKSLLSVKIPIVSRKQCQKVYEKYNTITENMFCAGYSKGGKDACQGDSGGPAVINGKLVGVVSWGKGCAREGTPGVYTNIPKYRKWIQSQIQSTRKG